MFLFASSGVCRHLLCPNYAHLSPSKPIQAKAGSRCLGLTPSSSDAPPQATGEVRNLLEEMPTTKLENSLRKLYIEDFYRFCQRIGGETAELMSGMLQASVWLRYEWLPAAFPAANTGVW